MSKNIKFHFVCLEAEKKEKTVNSNRMYRPVKSFSLDELGITHEQAKAICNELYGCKTIAAWLTEGNK